LKFNTGTLPLFDAFRTSLGHTVLTSSPTTVWHLRCSTNILDLTTDEGQEILVQSRAFPGLSETRNADPVQCLAEVLPLAASHQWTPVGPLRIPGNLLLFLHSSNLFDLKATIDVPTRHLEELEEEQMNFFQTRFLTWTSYFVSPIFSACSSSVHLIEDNTTTASNNTF